MLSQTYSFGLFSLLTLLSAIIEAMINTWNGMLMYTKWVFPFPLSVSVCSLFQRFHCPFHSKTFRIYYSAIMLPIGLLHVKKQRNLRGAAVRLNATMPAMNIQYFFWSKKLAKMCTFETERVNQGQN